MKPCFFSLLILFGSASLAAVEMAAQIEQEKVEALEPVKGIIRIVHKPDEIVDEKSFFLKDAPLQVKYVKQKKGGGGNLVSYYSFEIYPKEEGFNVLPAISATVGGEKLSSKPSTYTIKYLVPTSGLVLRALIRGQEPFYPGERLKFIYRIYYRGDVRLTKEKLPLFSAKGFQKIGTLNVKKSEYKGYQVMEFSQDVEVLAPGAYSFGKSVLEGVVNKTQTVRSEVEPIKLTVSPFPFLNRPPSFTGATGRWSIQAKLLTANHVRVGDQVELEITVSGSGNINSVKLPNIFCQPGFSGFFSLNGTPPIALQKNEEKIFRVQIIPQSRFIEEIPPIEFSSFDPQSRKYYTSRSAAIPLTAVSSPLPETKEPLAKASPPVDWEKVLSKEKVLHPLPYPLDALKKNTKSFDFWTFAWAIPIFVFLWLLQYCLRDYILSFWMKEKKSSPKDILRKAWKYNLEDLDFYRTIRETFRGDNRPEVKNFLGYLDGLRYGKMKGTKEDVLSKAEKLL